MRTVIKKIVSGSGKKLRRFAKLRKDFEVGGIKRAEMEISALIGTSTPAAVVFRAMRYMFDANYYLCRYEDVRTSCIDPSLHYMLWGWKEGRQPNKFFDPNFFCSDLNEDVKKFPLALALEDKTKPQNAYANDEWFVPFIPRDQDWESISTKNEISSAAAVVVIPVFKGVRETLCCIWHAISSCNGRKYAVIVINDGGPDRILNEKLRSLAEKNLFHYHESGENIGFVRTVNFAIRNLTQSKDVVLLNSDAYVFPGWFDRLSAHADRDYKIATITPLSNNATICSYPFYNFDNFYALEISPENLDQLAGRHNAGKTVIAPTGVGYCMYIRRSALDAIGDFDEEAFSIGYGEENDLCMRFSAAGWTNVVAGDVFVYHSGSVSFASSRDRHYSAGQLSLDRKYPQYSSLVQSHVSADPEQRLRRTLDLERLISSHTGAKVFVTHTWGGGIERYINDAIKQYCRHDEKFLILRVHDNHLVSFEDPAVQGLLVPNLRSIDLRVHEGFIQTLLLRMRPSLISVNSFAGLSWSSQISLMNIVSNCDCYRVFVGHDYSAISHYYNLLSPANQFEGLPSSETLAEWDEMGTSNSLIDKCRAGERHLAFSKFLKGMDDVHVPSEAAKTIFRKYFHDFDIKVVPHHCQSWLHKLPTPASGQEIRVVIIGAIGIHKGRQVLGAIAKDAINRNIKIKYHLVGYSDDDQYLKKEGVVVWGRYKDELEARNTIENIQPHLCFIPSIWPETYCYTLAFSLAIGLPTMSFDLGAQGERLRSSKLGIVLPLSASQTPKEINDLICQLDIPGLWRSQGSTQ